MDLTGTSEPTISLGASQLLRLAQQLLADGWRVREIDLRDFHLQPIEGEDEELDKDVLRKALQSRDEDVLVNVAAGLPYVIASIRLARGSVGNGAEWAKFYRVGRIESSEEAGDDDTSLDYLRRVVGQVLAVA